MLVWDMFRVHLLDSVKSELKRNRTYQCVIPGGCISVLQPLDVAGELQQTVQGAYEAEME